jgi:hypothetical protein
MKLTDADLLEFKAICKEELGIELSTAEAIDEAQRLLQLVSVIAAHLSRIH